MYDNAFPTTGTGLSPFAELLLKPALEARRMNVPAGKLLYSSRQPATHVYFVHRGQVRTYRIGTDGSGRLLEILGPDGWCGEAALGRHGEYGEQAVAMTACVVSEVQADRLQALLWQFPRIALEFLKQLANKLSSAREDAAGLVFEDCHQRLLKTLVRFSRSAAASPHPEGVVLRITHQQLAQAVGVARETVSLALTQLRQQKLLRTGRNQLMFDPQQLAACHRNGHAGNGNGQNGGSKPATPASTSTVPAQPRIEPAPAAPPAAPTVTH